MLIAYVAPFLDPTAGPSASDHTTWCLDEAALHENIKKTLIKFCIPSPVVLRLVLISISIILFNILYACRKIAVVKVTREEFDWLI